jgi:hypothetical protein
MNFGSNSSGLEKSFRANYVKMLRQAAKGKSKREYSYFLRTELEKKQDELHALEGMRRNEENFLANDEQREREISRSSDGQGMFTIGKASRGASLKDIEQRLRDVENEIFDIRTLLSEL